MLKKEDVISKIGFTEEDYYSEWIPMQILSLKDNLSETDYKAIKYAEGIISEEEYAPVREQRQKWREEINSLELEAKREH